MLFYSLGCSKAKCATIYYFHATVFPVFLSESRLLDYCDRFLEKKGNCKEVTLSFSNEILNLVILKGCVRLMILLTAITPQSVLEKERHINKSVKRRELLSR